MLFFWTDKQVNKETRAPPSRTNHKAKTANATLFKYYCGVLSMKYVVLILPSEYGPSSPLSVQSNGLGTPKTPRLERAIVSPTICGASPLGPHNYSASHHLMHIATLHSLPHALPNRSLAHRQGPLIYSVHPYPAPRHHLTHSTHLSLSMAQVAAHATLQSANQLCCHLSEHSALLHEEVWYRYSEKRVRQNVGKGKNPLILKKWIFDSLERRRKS